MPTKINQNRPNNTFNQTTAKSNSASGKNPVNSQDAKKTQLEKKQDIVLNQMNLLLKNRLVDALKTSTLTIDTAKQIKKDIIKDLPVENRQEIHKLDQFLRTLDTQIKNLNAHKSISDTEINKVKEKLQSTRFSGFTNQIFTPKAKIENIELVGQTALKEKPNSRGSFQSVALSSYNSKDDFDFLDEYNSSKCGVESLNSKLSKMTKDSLDSFVHI